MPEPMKKPAQPVVIEATDEGVMRIVGSLPRVVSENALADFVRAIFAVRDARAMVNGEVTGTFYFPV